MAVNNDFAYIEKTMPGRVDEVFVKESVTSILGGSFKLDFVDNKIIKVFKTSATPTTAYKRGGHGNANSTGATQSTLETFQIVPERWFSLPFDKLDEMEDAGTVFGHQTQNYVKEHIIPETDTYRLSKLAGYCSATAGNLVSEAITHTKASGILAKFIAAFKWMSERKVPEKNQVIYVSPDIMSDIRISEELVRYLSQSEYKGDVNFTIERFMGREIIEVPSDMFYTEAAYDANSMDGIGPTANSKLINFLIVDKEACIPVERLNWSKIYSSDQTDIGFVGSKYEGLINHDIFVLENKRVALYCSVSTTAAGTASGILLPFAAKGSSGKCKLTAVVTSPTTIMWDAIGLYTTNGTAPALGTSFADKSVAEYGNEVNWKEFTPDATVGGAHNIFVATLDGKVVATSTDYTNTLPVG